MSNVWTKNDWIFLLDTHMHTARASRGLAGRETENRAKIMRINRQIFDLIWNVIAIIIQRCLHEMVWTTIKCHGDLTGDSWICVVFCRHSHRLTHSHSHTRNRRTMKRWTHVTVLRHFTDSFVCLTFFHLFLSFGMSRYEYLVAWSIRARWQRHTISLLGLYNRSNYGKHSHTSMGNAFSATTDTCLHTRSQFGGE